MEAFWIFALRFSIEKRGGKALARVALARGLYQGGAVKGEPHRKAAEVRRSPKSWRAILCGPKSQVLSPMSGSHVGGGGNNASRWYFTQNRHKRSCKRLISRRLQPKQAVFEAFPARKGVDFSAVTENVPDFFEDGEGV